VQGVDRRVGTGARAEQGTRQCRRWAWIGAIGCALAFPLWSWGPDLRAAGQDESRAPEAEDCGPGHRRDVEAILKLRNPEASGAPRDPDSSLSLDRAVILTDFLRLQELDSPVLRGTPVRFVSGRLLRRQRETGRTSPEVCAVTAFMLQYYTARAGGTRVAEAAPPEPDDARAEAADAPAASAVASPIEPPSPRPSARASTETPAAPAPEPRPAATAPARRPAECTYCTHAALEIGPT